MKPILCACSLLLLLPGCASTFTGNKHLDISISHRLQGDQLIVTAEVHNRSRELVTLIEHPDCYSISVSASDRSKEEVIDLPPHFHYEKPTEEHLHRVPPGESTTMKQTFQYRRKPGGIIEIRGPQAHMRITDDQLQATLSYWGQRDYLPKDAWVIGRNYMMGEFEATSVFAAP